MSSSAICYLVKVAIEHGPRPTQEFGQSPHLNSPSRFHAAAKWRQSRRLSSGLEPAVGNAARSATSRAHGALAAPGMASTVNGRLAWKSQMDVEPDDFRAQFSHPYIVLHTQGWDCLI
ncbi:hypothetical protein N7462_003226 [Penicillium macrosclerotiorum]|uniref:uncharacterized protein n=1 Tax=Penicillium macrosclerotiorum TaxID=303699 RepID=UPI002548FEAA|nr:uncharacterized protein N7462_003226 [Penicillium macrosclerotiorum]KAJ5688834.1 hypothetical protein N7462_003226 [Penicillium macrosclerotiorum]